MRFLTAFVGTPTLTLVIAASALAQARPDFSGTWTLDPSSTSGGNAPQQITLTQDARTLTLSWTQDGRTSTETMNLDGSESRTQAGSAMRAGWEGNAIVVVISQNLGGNVMEQRRVLSIDRGNLVIDMTMPDPRGGNPAVVRFVYKKG
jgi:YD repeat-containing protein